MKSHLYHIQLNISFKNLDFYKELFTFLGWSLIFEMEGVVGFHSEKSGDVWFVDTESKGPADYDMIGMNHLAIRVSEQSDIDQVNSFINGKNIRARFETPKHRPEFVSDAAETYYQVMFASPDNILFEVVYIGAK